MTQSMSRVAHCIDNGPMEGFWGILKRERYYGRRFTNRQDGSIVSRQPLSLATPEGGPAAAGSGKALKKFAGKS